MSRLFLTVNALQCKKGQVYPETESDWSRPELQKILNLSGVSGIVPESYNYQDVVNLLIDRLNIQKPIIYALSTDKEILFNSQTVEIDQKTDTLNVGPYAILQKMEKHHDCETIWNSFFQYFHKAPRFLMEQVSPEQLNEKQVKIIKLEGKIQALEKQLKESYAGRMTAQFEEANELLKTYRMKIVEENQKNFEMQLKNDQLNKQIQQHEAQLLQYQNQINGIRSQLMTANDTTSTDLLEKLSNLKQKLAACESKIRYSF